MKYVIHKCATTSQYISITDKDIQMRKRNSNLRIKNDINKNKALVAMTVRGSKFMKRLPGNDSFEIYILLNRFWYTSCIWLFIWQTTNRQVIFIWPFELSIIFLVCYENFSLKYNNNMSLYKNIFYMHFNALQKSQINQQIFNYWDMVTSWNIWFIE